MVAEGFDAQWTYFLAIESIYLGPGSRSAGRHRLCIRPTGRNSRANAHRGATNGNRYEQPNTGTYVERDRIDRANRDSDSCSDAYSEADEHGNA